MKSLKMKLFAALLLAISTFAQATEPKVTRYNLVNFSEFGGWMTLATDGTNLSIVDLDVLGTRPGVAGRWYQNGLLSIDAKVIHPTNELIDLWAVNIQISDPWTGGLITNWLYLEIPYSLALNGANHILPISYNATQKFCYIFCDYYSTGSGQNGRLVNSSPVPEPTTAALTILGMLSICIFKGLQRQYYRQFGRLKENGRHNHFDLHRPIVWSSPKPSAG